MTGSLVVPGGPTEWTRIGVVSWGAGGAERAPMASTRGCPHYIDWMLEQTARWLTCKAGYGRMERLR